MSSSNHQPTLAPIAQHGLMDDVVYVSLSVLILVVLDSRSKVHC